MKTIYKYSLQLGPTPLWLPETAKVIHVDLQNGSIIMWVLLNPGERHKNHNFYVWGTGFNMPEDPGEHVGTVITANGEYVWHVFRENT